MLRSVAARTLLALILLASLLLSAAPAASITKSEVDEACSDSQEAKQVLDEAQAQLDAATAAHQEAYWQRDEVSYKQLGLRATIDDHIDEIDLIRDRVVERAVDMYMAGGAVQPGMLFSAGSVEDVITGQAYLDAATKDDVLALQRLEGLKVSLDEHQEEFTRQKAELDRIEAELAAIAQDQLALVETVNVAFNELDSECRTARAEYQRQLAIEAALKAARASGGAGGVTPEATPGFICPMPAPVSFINDWGFPRSGGRTHKGTDIFAAHGHPVVAVANGTIRLRSGGLGGTSVWLHADYGVSFYYAHLSGYAPGITDGAQVSIGQEIAYNGDTGNARGGAPHVHFQIHPGGSSRPAVNPYPTLSRNC